MDGRQVDVDRPAPPIVALDAAINHAFTSSLELATVLQSHRADDELGACLRDVAGGLDAVIRQCRTTAFAALVDSRATRSEIASQFVTALASRTVIDEAKGILMARDHVSGDAAFAQLRQRSQRENRKLRDVAQELVDECQMEPRFR